MHKTCKSRHKANPLRILILADAMDDQNAGIYFYTKNLIENLLKIDRVNKYSFIHSAKNAFFKNTENYVVPRKRGLREEILRRSFKIPKIVKKINPDIIFEPCHIMPFNLPKRSKKVVVIHDLTPVIFPHFHIKQSTIAHRLLMGRNLKKADLIIADSNTTKKDIIDRYKIDPNKITVIYLGIDLPQKKRSENKLPFGIDKPYILYVGTLEPRKNLITLIDAFVELKNTAKIPHKLVLAGDIGWKSEEIIKKAKQKDIILTGYVPEDEKSSLLRHADMFVYPSIYEGFGLPPLEAMSYGIPVISSTGGSLKEILNAQALLFDPYDKEKLKEHILTLIENPKNKNDLVREGKEYVKKFTWETTARETLKAMILSSSILKVK